MRKVMFDVDVYPYLEFTEGTPRIGATLFIGDSGDPICEVSETFSETLNNFIQWHLVCGEISEEDRMYLLAFLITMKKTIKDSIKEVKSYVAS